MGIFGAPQQPEGVSISTWITTAEEVGLSKATVIRARKKALESGVIGLGSAGTEKQPRYVVVAAVGVSDFDEQETGDDQA